MSRVHRGKGNACYLLCSGGRHGSNKNRQQFPGTVHEEDLHQGQCYTRGKVTSTRKCRARKNSLHRTYGLFMMHETSVKAASNGLDNFLAYQWFTPAGSKKGSKDSTF